MLGLMTLSVAIRTIFRNKVRSALTMLGVIIGAAAVIAVVSVGQGATLMVQKQIENVGSNLVMIFPGATSTGSVSMGVGSQQTLTARDAERLRRECPSAASVGIVVRTRAQIIYEDANWSPAIVQGGDPDFFDVRGWSVVDGECFTDLDVGVAAQVCLVGQTVVANVFHGESPVGKRIRVKNMPFRVVGVLDKKGANFWGQDQDDSLFVPYTTSQKKLQGSTFHTVDQLLAKATSAHTLASLEDEIRAVLRDAHRIRRDQSGAWQDDFTIRDLNEVMGTLTAVTKGMELLLAVIASISLVVGGIGIMNIMLVSVTERTREIGLRMAVGARGRDILAQFLVEAMTLSGLGGLVGIGCGVGVSELVSWLARWPSIVSLPSVAIGVGSSAAVGMVFGLYPAWRASQLDPIDALRYE